MSRASWRSERESRTARESAECCDMMRAHQSSNVAAGGAGVGRASRRRSCTGARSERCHACGRLATCRLDTRNATRVLLIVHSDRAGQVSKYLITETQPVVGVAALLVHTQNLPACTPPRGMHEC
eukprot:Mycagemm_TRINITY_DN10302_c2_g5::TRINITY_DN10302_c2_g5_i2::g.1379::m.1379 type:complete len:125 gc:universal TRINITY_DN10302_c2_g5_i2:1196-822(-)